LACSQCRLPEAMRGLAVDGGVGGTQMGHPKRGVDSSY
jgi:hypothetical protein